MQRITHPDTASPAFSQKTLSLLFRKDALQGTKLYGKIVLYRGVPISYLRLRKLNILNPLES